MRTPTQALLWRQWRMLRWPFLAVVMGTPAVFVCECAVHSWIKYHEYGGFTGVALVMSMLVLMAMTLSNGADVGERSLAFPWALFALPLRTARLAAIEYLGRVAIVALALFLTVGVAFAVDRHANATTSWLLSPFVFTSLFALVQGIAWWRNGAVAAAVVMVVCAPFPFVREVVAGIVVGFAEASAPQQLAMMLCAVLAGYLIGLPAVLRERSGRRLQSKEINLSLFRAPMAFASPEHAQGWYEWRTRYGWLPKITLLFFGFFALLVAPAFGTIAGVEPSSLLQVMSFMGVFLGAIWGLPTALFVWSALSVQEKWIRPSAQNVFVFTRPIPTRTLARIRLLAAAKALLVSIGVLVAAVAVYVLLLHLIGAAVGVKGPSIHYWLQDLALMYAMSVMALAFAYVCGCWALMSSGAFVIAAATIGLPMAIVGITIDYPPIVSVIGLSLACVIFCVPTAGLLFLARAGVRRGLCSRTSVGLYCALWAGLAFVAARYAPFLSGSRHADVALLLASALVLIAIASLPVYPFLLEPLSLHRQRHR